MKKFNSIKIFSITVMILSAANSASALSLESFTKSITNTLNHTTNTPIVNHVEDTVCPIKQKVLDNTTKIKESATRQESDQQKIIGTLKKLEFGLDQSGKQKVEIKISEVNSKYQDIKNTQTEIINSLSVLGVNICNENSQNQVNISNLKTLKKQLAEKNKNFKNYIKNDLKNFVRNL